MQSRNKAGKQILNVPAGHDVLPISAVADAEEAVLICASTDGYLLAYYLKELPELARGKGNKLINIPPKLRKEGVKAAGAIAIGAGQDCLVWAGQRYLRLSWSDTETYWGERAQRGRKLPRGFQNVTRLTLAE